MMLISVSKAEDLIHKALPASKSTAIPLTEANGYVLAMDIKAEHDYPPFDRITKDGIAITSANFTGEGQYMGLSGYAQAGKPQAVLEDASMVIEVATGAPLPLDTDAVIPYEEIEKQTDRVILNTKQVYAGQNIHPQGSDSKKGTILIEKDAIIGSPEIAILGSNGIQSVSAYAKPCIAIVTTGDELVASDAKVKPHQLRRSNDVMLQAALQGHGFTNIHCSHMPDDAVQLHAEFVKVLNVADVVLISGGVSKGIYDLIPDVLKKLAVKKIFHGVRQRPGKPMWFGKKADTLVFGLPGNPVSALTCALRYVVPTLKRISGYSKSLIDYKTLGEAVDVDVPFTVFLPVKANPNNEVVPLPHNGSGDFTSLVDSSGFIELSSDTNQFYAGERYPFIPWRAPCLF
jgi:molybdopterin molybdotransferase